MDMYMEEYKNFVVVVVLIVQIFIFSWLYDYDSMYFLHYFYISFIKSLSSFLINIKYGCYSESIVKLKLPTSIAWIVLTNVSHFGMLEIVKDWNIIIIT